MKSFILSCTLPLLVTLASAQELAPTKDAPIENVKKTETAAWLGIIMEQNGGRVTVGGIMDGSPAAAAGLQPGDVVLGIDKIEVQGDMPRVAGYIRERKPGDTVVLRFRRGDSEKSIEVRLAERPPLEGEFRGEFNRGGELQRKQPGSTAEGRQEGDKDPQKAHDETIKEFKSGNAGEDKTGDHAKHHGKTGDGHAPPDKTPAEKDLRAARDKLREAARAQAEKHKAAREQMQKHLHEFKELQREYGKLFRPGKPDARQPAPLLRWYLDREWPGDPDKSGAAEPKPKKQRQEDAVWEQVEQSVGRALKEADLEADVIEKVMRAVAAARKHGNEDDARRAKLEAEADRLEKEMEALREKAGRIREELKKSER